MPRFTKVTALVAVLALCLTGGATAAMQLTGKDIRDSTVTTKDIKNRSLLAKDFKSGQLPRGPQGPQGPQGPAGPSVVGKIAYVERSFNVVAGDVDIQGVQCPAGHSIVSGGWTIISGAAVPFVDKSYSGSEWSVGVDNFDGLSEALATAHAWCAPTGAAVVARAANSVASLRARDESRQRAAH